MALTIILMSAARPVSVFLSLLPFKLGMRVKSNGGMDGAQGIGSIILATFPFLMANIQHSSMMFDIVFLW